MRAANRSARPLEHVGGAGSSPASTNRSPVRQSAGARPRQVGPEARRLKAARLATPKILLYSHDTFGLGNIRRTLLLAEELSGQYPGAAVLMVTGSQMVHSFRIPEGVDYIKLPCLDRVDAERYEPRFLRSWSEEVKRTRSAILEKSVLGFEPDLMIVDKRPAGVDGELAATLEEIRRKRLPTKLVLGVRDILDEPERTRRNLENNGSFETIERFYDEVWVYGSRSIFDTVREYGFPERVAAVTRFCGYLKRPTAPRTRAAGPPHVLVTTGGGGDGTAMTEAYLEGLASLPRNVALRTTVVFGPQMSDGARLRMRERFGYLADVTFSDFEPDLTRLYSASDIVVSMAGYNTVCELLSFGHHAILVPRAEPVQEQLIRARLLAAQGLFDIVEPQELGPATLISKVLAALKPVEVARVPFDLDGLPRIRERMRALLGGEEEEA
jgi:predicted glycosyltransferase